MNEETITVHPPLQVQGEETSYGVVYYDPETNQYYGRSTGPYDSKTVIPHTDIIPLFGDYSQDSFPFDDDTGGFF